ncbi:hypothetical protein K488DRAFT_89333 [Vararia minispora EC-137]|uniref:Uncharacterized protein n=1 Tax=Vararia minispora EC-137 TaxID=1314806 RepID=A0ACB8QAJ0_9AGAM|nr:hypothetical protein K488DRAFT_89333 [Vararia minispora EC-137]
MSSEMFWTVAGDGANLLQCGLGLVIAGKISFRVYKDGLFAFVPLHRIRSELDEIRRLLDDLDPADIQRINDPRRQANLPAIRELWTSYRECLRDYNLLIIERQEAKWTTRVFGGDTNGDISELQFRTSTVLEDTKRSTKAFSHLAREVRRRREATPPAPAPTSIPLPVTTQPGAGVPIQSSAQA